MNNEEKSGVLNIIAKKYKTSEISISELAKEFKVTKKFITDYFKSNNIQIRKPKNRKSTINIIKELSKTNSIKEISEKTGVCSQAIELIISNLSTTEYKREIINMAIEEYKNTPRLDRSISKLSDKYGLNRKTIVKYIKNEGIKIENSCNASSFNEHIFQKIDTEEKAYWLGFLYADGYTTVNRHEVGLSLAIKDIDHLKKFNKFLSYSKGLNIQESHQFGSKSNLNSKGEEMYMVKTAIRNINLWTDLNNAGCIPNKSLILTFPSQDILPKQLILHFIRGYFDGDGTLGIYKHSVSNPTLEESLMFVGTKPFLEKVQEYLGKGFLMQKTNCNKLTYRLSYSTTKANKAARLMYDNATIYLKRKYNIYLKFLCRRKIG